MNRRAEIGRLSQNLWLKKIETYHNVMFIVMEVGRKARIQCRRNESLVSIHLRTGPFPNATIVAALLVTGWVRTGYNHVSLGAMHIRTLLTEHNASS